VLFKHLDNVQAKIDSINIQKEIPNFISQLRRMRPNLGAEIAAQGISKEQTSLFLSLMCVAHLTYIKGISAISAEMRNIIQTRSHEPAFRLLLTAALVYLAHPKDILPDDLPGGYGFVDDALMLYAACALSWQIAGNELRAAEDQKKFQFLFTAVPDDKKMLFQNALTEYANLLNILRFQNAIIIESQIQTLINNPFQEFDVRNFTAPTMPAPPAWSQITNYPSMAGPQMAWKSGNTMVVNFPGGGGVAADSTGVYVL
jgi:uncharacterized membrane protein YkvA (DUF1232 family)